MVSIPPLLKDQGHPPPGLSEAKRLRQMHLFFAGCQDYYRIRGYKKPATLKAPVANLTTLFAQALVAQALGEIFSILDCPRDH